jgi:hypothetical protein
MEQLENRALGRAKETVEHQTSDVDRIEQMTPEERDIIRRRIEARELDARRMGLVDSADRAQRAPSAPRAASLQ